MIKKGQKIVLYAVITLFLVALSLLTFVQLAQKPAVSTSIPSSLSVVLPPTVFDSTVTVSSTDLSFSYPSKGFYGLGIKVFPFPTTDEPGVIAAVATNPLAPFTDEKTSEYVVLNVSLLKNKQGWTPEQMIVGFPFGTIDKEAAKTNGAYVKVGSHQFFVYKSDEGVTSLTALATSTEGMVDVNLAYRGSDKPESKAAYAHNDELFTEILSHVDFK